MNDSIVTIFCNGESKQRPFSEVYLVDEGGPVRPRELFPESHSPMLLFDNKAELPPAYAFFSDELARLFIQFHMEWVKAGIVVNDWSLVPFVKLEQVISALTGVRVCLSKLVQYPSDKQGPRWYVECHVISE